MMRIRPQREADSWLGIAVAAAAGLGAGLLAGLVLSELLGNVSADRVRRAVQRLRSPEAEDEEDRAALERAVEEMLGRNPTTRQLNVGVRALGHGIVELTGTAPDTLARRLAGDVARGVPGADVVVNRILVEGVELPRPEPSSSRAH